MKTIEYYYNLIYYFFYRGYIGFAHFIDILLRPVKLFFLFIAKRIPSIQKKYKKRGITNPEEYFDKWMKNVDENPSLSLGTMYGGGLTMVTLAGFYAGFYKIFNNLFIPEFESSFKYIIIISFILAFITDMFLDQGEKYIKQFNKIKDKSWRRKWGFITALTFPLSITFMVMTSKSSYIGGFLYAVHQYLFH